MSTPMQEAAMIEIERLTRRVNAAIASVEPLVEEAAALPLDLSRDCQCQTHTGPHWLHMDGLWRDRNQQLLRLAAESEDDLARSLQAYRGYLTEESERLRVHEQDLRRAIARTAATTASPEASHAAA